MTPLTSLLEDVRACTLCAPHLPLGPRPVVQMSEASRILIAGQAPGRRVHETGIPFNDVSGDRLRQWLGLSREVFYDDTKLAILGMGFCFPGTGKSGDLPPRPECAPTWRAPLLAQLKNLRLMLVVGQYAMAYHLPGRGKTLTDVVTGWRRDWPLIVPLPHPSPRNQAWLKRNPWFERDLLPVLRLRIAEVLRGDD
jgi:uracil-DNA glycosylase